MEVVQEENRQRSYKIEWERRRSVTLRRLAASLIATTDPSMRSADGDELCECEHPTG